MSVRPITEIPELLRNYKDKDFESDAKKALAAIADEKKPLIVLNKLKKGEP